jgi:hypothetical protein
MKDKLGDEPVKFGYPSGKPLLSAMLVSGERSLKLETRKASFMVPLGDRSWSDEALVQLEFAPQESADEKKVATQAPH